MAARTMELTALSVVDIRSQLLAHGVSPPYGTNKPELLAMIRNVEERSNESHMLPVQLSNPPSSNSQGSAFCNPYATSTKRPLAFADHTLPICGDSRHHLMQQSAVRCEADVLRAHLQNRIAARYAQRQEDFNNAKDVEGVINCKEERQLSNGSGASGCAAIGRERAFDEVDAHMRTQLETSASYENIFQAAALARAHILRSRSLVDSLRRELKAKERERPQGWNEQLRTRCKTDAAFLVGHEEFLTMIDQVREEMAQLDTRSTVDNLELYMGQLREALADHEESSDAMLASLDHWGTTLPLVRTQKVAEVFVQEEPRRQPPTGDGEVRSYSPNVSSKEPAQTSPPMGIPAITPSTDQVACAQRMSQGRGASYPALPHSPTLGLRGLSLGNDTTRRIEAEGFRHLLAPKVEEEFAEPEFAQPFARAGFVSWRRDSAERPQSPSRRRQAHAHATVEEVSDEDQERTQEPCSGAATTPERRKSFWEHAADDTEGIGDFFM